MEKMYTDLLDKPMVIYILSGLLMALGVVTVATQGQATLTLPLQGLLLSGELLYAIFVAILIVLVIVGWHIDDLPGKSISLAVPLLLFGSLVRVLLPLAQSSGWLGEWNGVMLGVIIISIYLAWRIQARFALIAIVAGSYTVIVTSGFVFGVVQQIAVPHILGLLASGAMAIILILLSFFRIKGFIRTARREAIKNHIVKGALASIRITLLSGITVILFAIPFIILAESVFRSFGLIFFIGGLVSIFTALATPMPLIMATSNLELVTDSSRKTGKRRKS